MCDTCRKIDAGGKTPAEMLEDGAVLIGLRGEEPLFESVGGSTWELVRDPITESSWFVPYRETP